MNVFWSDYCHFEDWLYRRFGLPPFIEWPWFQLFVLAVSGVALWPAFRIYWWPPKEMRMRSLGVNKSNYQRIRPLALLACIEAALGGATSLTEILRPGSIPWPFDLLILAALLFSSYSLIRSLRKRPKFKPKEFVKEVLAPIGLTFLIAIPAGGRTVRNTPRIAAAAASIPGADEVAKAVRPVAESAVVRNALDFVGGPINTVRGALGEAAQTIGAKLPSQVDVVTVAGARRFSSRLAMGGSGEAVTVRLYENMGLEYIKSQVNNKGIDAVFIRKNKAGKVIEVYVVETKVNGSRLSLGQMSDDWIEKGCKLANKEGGKQRQAAKYIEDARNPENGIVLHRHLVHHDLGAGVSKRYSLSTSGEVATEQWSGITAELMTEEFAKMEAKGNCQRLPDLYSESLAQ
jgi:hypothetical protein